MSAWHQTRIAMIKQQLQPNGVVDPRLLAVLAHVPREQFVPSAFQAVAYADIAIPLGSAQSLPAPLLLGQMLQALAITSTDRVLELGAGSGYVTAVLASLAAQVVSIEPDSALLQTAQAQLHSLSLHNVRFMPDWLTEQEPFTVVLATRALPKVPTALRALLSVGGRMVLIVGTPPAMGVVLITRLSQTSWVEKILLETECPYLAGTVNTAKFTF